MKKFLLLIAAVLALSVSAFAENEVYFADSLECSTSSITQNFDSADSVFFCLASGYNAGSYKVYALSDDSASTYNITSSGETSSFEVNTSIDSLQGVYYNQAVANAYYVSIKPELSVFPYGTTIEEIAQSFSDFLANIPDNVVSGRFSVPCGNVAYFQVATSQTVNFKSVYQILSRPFANSTYGYWSDSGQRFGSASGLPTPSTSFPLASQSPLYWTPDPQSKNLLGLSKTGLASASCRSGQWYAFYNPAYNSNNTDFTTMDITGATVSISGSFSAIKIYPLEQVVDYQNGAFVGSSNDDYTSYYDGTIGEDGNITFTNQDGVADTPVAGGQNLLAPNETYQSIIDKVVGLLQNIVSEIKSLFSFGYEAINDLAGLMSNFGHAISGLYTWLPSEVHAALISAVSIAIVIGVFKVFI